MSKGLNLTLWLTLVASPVAAQVGERRVAPMTCEENIALLDAVHNIAGEKGLIIAVARLGDGESRQNLSWRRLHNVRAYLTEFGWKRDPNTLVSAQGERVKGFGRVELYLEGRLVEVLPVKTNLDLPVGSCEPDDIRPKEAEKIFYPYRGASAGKRKKKGER